MSTLLQGVARHLMPHRYTRIPRVEPGTTDDLYDPVSAPGATVPDVPCRYEPAGTVLVAEEGAVIRENPTLLILPDDPLKVGDRVQDILDRRGRLILKGSFRVMRKEFHGGRGDTLEWVCELEGARV